MNKTPNLGRLPAPRAGPPAHLLQRPHLPLGPVLGPRRRLLAGADRGVARAVDPVDARVVHLEGAAAGGQGVLLAGDGPQPEGDEVGVSRRQGLVSRELCFPFPGPPPPPRARSVV